MYMKPSFRHNRQGKEYVYYRLCDTYRDSFGIARRRELANVGRLDDFTLEEAKLVGRLVTEKASGSTPESDSALAMPQIAIRAVHPASELATSKWIRENSDICRLTGFEVSKVKKDTLYKSAIKLYDVREELKDHLSKWTKELFDYEDNLILYDLTNVYAEGCYDNSKVWDYGLSKEKRHDCKLVVLDLVVNQYGFPKHY